jgi:outer membrane protein assembly factor BamE (lipoprotein component of BamABCDE complex)
MRRQIITILTICFLLTSCKDKIPFDKAGWTIQGDLGLYPNRDKMLDDLIKNQNLKGLTYRQLIDKIGEPEKNEVGDSNTIFYDIVTDFGHDIDPVFIKSLEIKFDKDSIVTDFKINEIKH